VRNLNQHTGAVAGLRIAAAGAAVGQVDQDLNALLNDGVSLLSADAGYKADAAGVVLGRRVIEALRGRQTVVCLPIRQKMLLALVVGVCCWLLGGELRRS
jgi:hypothetical protein